jgi:hypothetical protein
MHIRIYSKISSILFFNSSHMSISSFLMILSVVVSSSSHISSLGNKCQSSGKKFAKVPFNYILLQLSKK